MKSIVVVSGGMDSAAALWWAIDSGRVVPEVVSFDYGQRHRRELQSAAELASSVRLPHLVVDVPLGALAPSSALTGDIDVPHGHYSADTMTATVVPNRNMTFIALAAARAAQLGCEEVVVGVHAGDHPIYPDCRPEFIDAVSQATELAVGVTVNAPFVHMTKADIAKAGDVLGVPWAETWSCYEGGTVHCGRCGTCVERAEAFAEAGVDDPTAYQDPTYWKQVVGT